MKRRAYLSALGTITTSGCVGTTMLHAGTGPGPRRISVDAIRREPPAQPANLSPNERPDDLALDVEVVDARIDETTPARLAVRYINRGSEPVTLNVNPDAPDPHESTAEEPGLILLPDTYHPDPVEAGCWQPRSATFPVPAVAYQHPVPPGEDVRLPYEVWASPQQSAACIQPGTYAFEVLYGSFTVSVTPV